MLESFYYFYICIHLDDLMNDNSSFCIDDNMMLVPPDNFNASELLMSPIDIPNVLPDNSTCEIDSMEELQKYIDTSYKIFLFN